jgi:phage host-nuclease inhibitor protein Gam
MSKTTQKREALKPIPIGSQAAMESCVADYVRATIERTQLQTALDAEVAAVTKRHQAAILAKDAEIARLEQSVYLYCAQNRAGLFPDKKSIDTPLAVVGFRFGKPAVDKVGSKVAWKDVVTRLLGLDWGADYVRDGEPEVDKSKILANANTLTAEQLATAGILISQEETFYIEPKPETAIPSAISHNLQSAA